MITPAYSPTATERVLPRLALDFTTGVLDPRVTVTRALNTATRVNSGGLIELVNANLPRFDYDPISLLPRGLLIEEQRANLFTRSAELDVAPWNKVAATVTANSAVAPDGTSTADKIVATATSTFHYVYQSVTETTAAQTFSVYAKASEYSKLQFADAGAGAWSATFDLASGSTIATSGVAVLSSSIQNAGNGWYRCAITYTGSGAFTAHAMIGYPNTGATLNNFGASYTGDGTSGIFVWGAQLEAGAFATSYIPTTTTSVTRNADVVSMTGTNFSSWYTSTTGSVLAEWDIVNTTGTKCAYYLTNAAETERIRLHASLSNINRYTVTSGGSTIVLDTAAATTGITKSVIGFKASSYAASFNGAAVITNTTLASVPTTPDQLQIGRDGASSYLNGWMRRVSYWPQRLINSEVQSFAK